MSLEGENVNKVVGMSLEGENVNKVVGMSLEGENVNKVVGMTLEGENVNKVVGMSVEGEMSTSELSCERLHIYIRILFYVSKSGGYQGYSICIVTMSD